jgi:hypothetical protein
MLASLQIMKNVFKPMQLYTVLRHDTFTVSHKPTANLSCLQKSAYYAGIKIFSNLPSDPRSPMNEKAQFKITLKRYLNTLILLC